MILSGATLYGTASQGGTNAAGTVFAVKTNGTQFTDLHSFAAYGNNQSYAPGYPNSDGACPLATLVLSGSTLYGTASVGGTWGNGTIFAVSTNGSGFTNLHSFGPSSGSEGFSGTNSDGVDLVAGLILSGNTLYGTAANGGSGGSGTVYKISTNGTDFTTLHSFTVSRTNSLGFPTNSDGVYPVGELSLSGNTLFGTTAFGGTGGSGTVFKINIDGTGFTPLYNFTAFSGNNYTNSDGRYSAGVLVVSGNALYGTAYVGGPNGLGTVFRLSLPQQPQLAIILSGLNVILSWPTNNTGFTLQSATNILPAAWSTVSPSPLVVNGQYTVTNAISSTSRFYRLTQ